MQLFQIKNIGIYHSKLTQPATQISKDRKTSLFELEIPLECGGISYIDSEHAPITENLLICAKPNQIRHTKFPFKCRYIHLSIFNEPLRQTLLSVPTFLKIKEVQPYLALFEELQKLLTSQNPNRERCEIMAESLLLKLIYWLLCESEHLIATHDPNQNSPVQKSVRYINDHLSSDLTLNTVAEAVSVSPIHFHNCFKAAIGKTLHAYVEEKRLEEAVNLMIGTDMTLTEIAMACGFSSQSYFNTVFKRKMNLSPRKYVQFLNKTYEE